MKHGEGQIGSGARRAAWWGLAWVVAKIPTTLAQLLIIAPAMTALYMWVGRIAPVSRYDSALAISWWFMRAGAGCCVSPSSVR